MWNAVCNPFLECKEHDTGWNSVNFVTCMENMPLVVQWYRDGCDCLMKDAGMCMIIHGAANCLWWMKIWCVQLKGRLGRTDDSDSPLRHFLCIFLKFHGHFLTKLCLRSNNLLPLASHRRQHHSTMKGYKNWCNAMTSASTMVETMSKSSVQYVHKMAIYMVCKIFIFFLIAHWNLLSR